ncbi:MAG: MATE family efflux transporter, partial [Winogradskyella sp.]
MKKFFHYINNEVLVKAASLNTANISIKILAGILISKFIALFIGPEGMALIGNLRNFLSTIQSISIAGLYNGFVKLISKHKNDLIKLTNTLSTVFYFGFFSSLLLAFLCYYNAEFINNLIFFNNNYVYVIETMAIVLPFYALNMYVFAIMNGFSKYRILLVINITGQVLGLLVTLLLIKQENIDGALIAVVITPALNLLITIVGIAFRKNLMSIINITNIQTSVLRKLSPNMIMALVSSIALPIVYIIIRNYIIS